MVTHFQGRHSPNCPYVRCNIPWLPGLRVDTGVHPYDLNCPDVGVTSRGYLFCGWTQGSTPTTSIARFPGRHGGLPLCKQPDYRCFFSGVVARSQSPTLSRLRLRPYIAGSARFRLSPVRMQCAIPSMISWRWEGLLTKSNRWLLTVKTGLSA